MEYAHVAPTTKELDDAFASEVRSLGGYIADRFADGDRLFMRAVLPLTDDVTPGDTINGGIAIRVAASAIFVHPYTMRQVCTNGAISAHATQSVRIDRVTHDGILIPSYEIDATLVRFIDAIHGCAAPEAFRQATDDMRAAVHTPFNLGISFLQALDGLQPTMRRALMRVVLDRMGRDDDQTMFDYMNAITATAREADDPEVRWCLEEIGGTVMARVGEPSPEIALSLAGAEEPPRRQAR
jgi:hypothetical protein